MFSLNSKKLFILFQKKKYLIEVPKLKKKISKIFFPQSLKKIIPLIQKTKKKIDLSPKIKLKYQQII